MGLAPKEMKLNDKTEYGLKVFGELLGAEKGAAMRANLASTGFASDLGKLAVHYAFADVWGRDGLERKQRSLVTLGILIASRQMLELKNHVRIAIANGLTPSELEEVLIQSVPYVGFPAVASATTVVIETLREMGIDLQTKTAEERGLL